jgi:outer membrane protein OmpA-like peptidoglycan-associated protein
MNRRVRKSSVERVQSRPPGREPFQSPLNPVLKLQGALGNRHVARLIQAKRLTLQGQILGIQRKATVGAADDHFEQEADRVARRVINAPVGKPLQRAISPAGRQPPPEKDEIQASRLGLGKDAPGSLSASAGFEASLNLSRGFGSPLPDGVRAYMEPRFGLGFGHVRVHTGSDAIRMSRDVGAQAFTCGADIYFGAGHGPSNSELTAHELTHVVQQTGGGPRQSPGLEGTSASRKTPARRAVSLAPETGATAQVAPRIQRRLIVSGSNEALVNEYLTIIGTASGLRLNWAFRQPRVAVGGNLPGAVPSPNGRANLLRVINQPTQHAELHIGTNQPRVAVGAFPGAGSTIQTIDVDDIRNLNAALPGQGTAKAFHEMMENFNAHGVGFGNFGASHTVGLEAESDVLENQGIVGRRLGGGIAPTVIPAPVGQPTGPNITYLRQLQDFTHYFLEIIQRRTTGSATGPGADFEVVSARRIPKVQVSQRSIDSFLSGSTAVPAAGNVTLATTLADLNGNPNSTLLIEGFSDNVGSQAGNVTTSRNRAATAQAFFVANGIAATRIAIVGRGETNFVATNANAAGRLQNRRIQLTVHRPGP